ncbi:MAG: hypothetical protein H0U57_03510 [Tatlockia sp.]|nr:hypothetical protein [Tatlockia sp.]
MFQKNESNPLTKRLSEFFYDSLVDLALADEEIILDNFSIKLKYNVEQIIINCLQTSRNFDNKIQLPNGIIIDAQNCPYKYLDFYIGLKKINNLIQFYKVEEHINLRNINFINSEIESLTLDLMNFESFKKMIPEATNFILEAKGLLEVKKPLDETGITPELIRNTFYNEMVNQTLVAISSGLIDRDDLEGQEAYIYFALSGLTIFEAIYHSKDCSGIELLDNKVVNRKNCPPSQPFPAFVEGIMKAKEMMHNCYGDRMMMSENDQNAIKQLCLLKNSEKPLNLKYTPETIKCATEINSISTQISQTPIFRQMISLVIETCLECLEPSVKLS